MNKRVVEQKDVVSIGFFHRKVARIFPSKLNKRAAEIDGIVEYEVEDAISLPLDQVLSQPFRVFEEDSTESSEQFGERNHTRRKSRLPECNRTEKRVQSKTEKRNKMRRVKSNGKS